MSLFDNKFVNDSKSNMTPQQLEEYEKKGKAMYEAVNFETSTVNNLTTPLSVSNIEKCLKSGLDIEDLTVEEIIIISKHYGDNWKDIVENF